MWNKSSTLLVGAVLSFLISVAGCYAEVTPDAEYVETSPPVVDVATYPRYRYRGEAVYWVNDRWYARHRGGWVYYRSEPAELHRRRVYVEQAPPARPRHRDRQDHGDAPRARRVD